MMLKLPPFRLTLIILTIVTCVVYLVYRACFTINFTTPYAVTVSLALLIAELFMGVLMFLFLLQVWRVHEPPEQPVLPDRTVDILVPTYNEDVEMLRTTVLACMQMDYPHKTYICDDGGTDARINDAEKGAAARERQDALKALCAEVGAIYMTRAKNEHAKAGNMNSVLKQTDGEFVVILDADHVPDRNFITRLIGYFSDEQLAFVQTPHAFYNFDNFQALYDPVRATYSDEGELFYDVIQPGRNHWNAAIFAGSAAMFRRQSLVEIGGFAVETITEDLHTGLRLHARGWKSIAISQRLIAGQAAPDVTTFHSQRLRWGEGNLSIFAYDNPLTTRGLTLAQRLCYFASMIHWASGPFMLVIFLTPLLMLFSSVPPVARFEWVFATLIVLYMFLSIFTFYFVTNGLGRFWQSQIHSMTNVWTSTRGLLRAMFLRRFQKFVVTSKRGRQSKGVLPYIWPHVTFFLASMLALGWAWYRPFSGVSDDYYKPIMASLWAVFHISAVLVVLRRALWAEDARFAYRQVVALPAALTSAEGGPERFAVTVDLNDRGVGLLAYEPLAVGSRCQVTIRCGGRVVCCLAEVRRCQEIDARLRAGTRGVRAYRCGLTFVEPSLAQTDLLNEICLHYAVPLSYAVFALHRLRRASQPPLRLPLLIFRDGAADPDWYAVTDNLFADGLTALLDADVPVGTEVRFRMPTPGEEVSGMATVVESRPTTLAARTYRECRLAFVEVNDAGRATLDVLLGGENARRLGPLLRPHKEQRHVPLLRPAAAAVLLLAVLAPLTLGIFHFNYRDELFLRRIADVPLPLSAEQDSRLQTIFRQTIFESRYPSDDRLVLLENALLHADLRSDVVQVTRVLAKRDLNNLGLQLAYAQALDDMGEPAAGLQEYQNLLGRIEKGDFPAERHTAVLLAAARTAVHAGQLEQAIPWFHEVLANSPSDDVAVRNELAGVLLSANQPQEAIALFAQLPQDWEGALLLAKARLLAGDYATAEKDAQQLLGRRPRDLDASLLLLDALARQGKLAEARALGSTLIEENPGPPPMVRIRAAQTALAVARYPAALQLFQGLLLHDGTALGTNEPVIQRGFIDAASSIQTLELIDPGVVQKIAGAAQGGWLAKDGVYLQRLAWVCQRLADYDLAAALLRRADELEPESEDIRQRYVGVLLAANRGPDAARFLERLPHSRQVFSLRVDVYLHDKNYDAIERLAKADLQINPLSYHARIALIEVALSKKDFGRAQELLAMVREFPPQSLEQRAQWANAELWAGNGATALTVYRSLLAEAPKQKDLWSGFISAASAAPDLSGEDAKLIRSVAEQFAKGSEDVILLSRLAWVLYRLKETPLVEQVLDRALALKPTDPAARKELAGMLGAAGRFKEALALYQGLSLDAEDRRRLGRLYEAAQDFTGAAAQYRLILEKQPDDQATRERLGLVLSWNKDFGAAAAVYEQLAAAEPSNPAWAARAAELKLWSGDAAALAAYSRILEPDPRQPHLWRGFVDAAGTVPHLDAAQAKLARRVGLEVLAWPPREIIPGLGASTVGMLGAPLGQGPLLAAAKVAPHGPERDPLFLSRLAWVLVKSGATPDAEAVLARADALHPTDPAALKELAGVFGAVGRFQRAIALVRGLDLSFADRLRLVQFYNGDHDFVAAEAELHRLLKLRPGDREVEMMLADVLAWQGKPVESAALLQQLRKADPDSKELTRRLAQVELWAHNYSESVNLFARLLDGNPNQPELWGDFAAAAAAAPSLDNRYRKLLVGLADKALADPPKDALFLSRLAQSVRTLKEPDKAADLLMLAVKIDPSSRPITLQLAQTLYDAGRLEEAKRYFTAVLPVDDRGR